MTWAVWCAAFLMLGGVSTQPLPSTDEENFNLLLPSLSAQYQPAAWRQVLDPNLYLYAELDQKPAAAETRRSKRRLPSLSIVNPMEVLRQRLVLEIARKQRQNVVRQAEENRAFLQNVGKRSYQPATYDELAALAQLRRHSAALGDQRQQAERPNADERDD